MTRTTARYGIPPGSSFPVSLARIAASSKKGRELVLVNKRISNMGYRTDGQLLCNKNRSIMRSLRCVMHDGGIPSRNIA